MGEHSETITNWQDTYLKISKILTGEIRLVIVVHWAVGSMHQVYAANLLKIMEKGCKIFYKCRLILQLICAVL